MLPQGSQSRRVQEGFPLSDHADHTELLSAITATGAERIMVTHGYIDEFVIELKSLGFDAVPMKTPRCRKPPRVTEQSAVA